MKQIKIIIKNAIVAFGFFCVSIMLLTPRLNAIENSSAGQGLPISLMANDYECRAVNLNTAASADGVGPTSVGSTYMLYRGYLSSTNCSGTGIPGDIIGLTLFCTLGIIGSFHFPLVPWVCWYCPAYGA